MAIPVQFILRSALPLIVTALMFTENYGPDQVRLYDQVQRASDVALHHARGEDSGSPPSFDYIVIGGGSAGAVVANRLSASGADTVLLLEAGGDPNPISDVPLGRRHIQAAGEMQVRYRSVPQANACVAAGSCSSPRGKTLGGCSVNNGCLYNKCQPKDYDLWANFTGDAYWSYPNVLESYKRIETYDGFYVDNPDNNRGSSGEMFVSKMDYIPGSDVFLEAFEEQGVPHGDFNSGNFQFGYTKIDYNLKDGLRQSAYTAFLAPILDRPNLKIYRYATATKINIDSQNRAFGVTYERHNKTLFVTVNKEIIVSGGAYESPKLLMLSGIGPAAHLAEHGIPTIVDLPAVGDYLQDHAAIGFRSHPFSLNTTFGITNWFNDASLLQYVQNGTGPLNSFEFGPAFAPQIAMGYTTSTLFNDRTWPDIQTYAHEEIVALDGVNTEDRFYVDHALMRPESYGTVRLASANVHDMPLIDFQFFNISRDLERLVDGVEFTNLIMLNSPKLQSLGIKWSDSIVPDPACTEHTFASRDYFRCWIIQRSSTHFHPTSTCRMGPNNTVAVVDSQLRVFGTTGLRVIDASVMPFVPSGNTNFPAFMVGDMGARLILSN